MTPLHGRGHAELRVIGLVISLHVLGMFAFSPGHARRPHRAAVRPWVEGAGLLLVSLVLCAAPEGSSCRSSWVVPPPAGLVVRTVAAA